MTPEHKLQTEIFQSYNNRIPGKRGSLIATFHETDNAVQASLKLSRGLVAGVPDFLMIEQNVVSPIEVKVEGSSHNVDGVIRQCEWMLKWCPKGCYFCTSLDMFWSIYYYGVGISVQSVYEYLKDVVERRKTTGKKLATFKWDNSKFKLTRDG